MRIQILNFILSMTAVVSASGPAFAQSAATANTALENGIRRTQMRPGVRYTTGSYVVTGPGFEKDLVNGDPNLGHWNWSPVIGYNQSMVKTSKQAVAAPLPERKSVYIRPNHVPLPVVSHPTAKISTKTELLPPVSTPVEGASSRHSDVNTHLVFTYGGNYRGQEGVRAAVNVKGVLAHRSVGAVLSQSMQY